MWDVAVRLREMQKGLVTSQVTHPSFAMSEQVAAHNCFLVLLRKRKSLGFNIIDTGSLKTPVFCFLFSFSSWISGGKA